MHYGFELMLAEIKCMQSMYESVDANGIKHTQADALRMAKILNKVALYVENTRYTISWLPEDIQVAAEENLLKLDLDQSIEILEMMWSGFRDTLTQTGNEILQDTVEHYAKEL